MHLRIKRRLILTPHSLLDGTNFLLFCIMMFVKAYGDAALAHQTTLPFSDDVKYLVMVLAAGLMLLRLISGGKLRSMFIREFKAFFLLMGIWLLISLVLAPNFQYPVHASVKYWIYILLPFFYGFSAVSVLRPEEIRKYFRAALVICFGVYLFAEIGPARFTPENFLRISFSRSFSPFESSYSAGASVMLCAYFSFNREKNGPWLAASTVFCLLTFKRAAIVMAFLCLILPRFVGRDRRVSEKWMIFQGTAVVALTVLAAWLLSPGRVEGLEALLHMDLNGFTQGRVHLYGLLVRGGYRPAGLDSSMDFLGNMTGKYGMELELIQLLWEVTPVGLAAFVVYCSRLTRRNFYCVLLMDYTLFNMLTSSSLGAPFEWLLLYLIVLDIHRQNREAPGRRGPEATARGDQTESEKMGRGSVLRRPGRQYSHGAGVHPCDAPAAGPERIRPLYPGQFGDFLSGPAESGLRQRLYPVLFPV